MEREILFRGKRIDNGKWVEGHYYHKVRTNEHVIHGTIKSGICADNEYSIIPETIGQFTGLIDKKGKKIFEGDRFLFWVCYPTTQTHTGGNIPNGSYTEPDETQFLKLEAQVIWDEDSAKWSYSLISKVPYQFSQRNNIFWDYNEETIPIIGRTPYSLEYIKEYYGYEDISDEEWQKYLSDVGFASEHEMMNEVNKIEVIGTIHDVK